MSTQPAASSTTRSTLTATRARRRVRSSRIAMHPVYAGAARHAREGTRPRRGSPRHDQGEGLVPHIDLPPDLPGILGPMAFSPDTSRPLNQLAEVLLRSDGTLSPAERELIATRVSARNECRFC